MTGNNMAQIHVIVYVKDQTVSRDFYMSIFKIAPSLDVPGMTEFQLLPDLTIGLMPEKSIATLISPPRPHPETGSGIPRCELYLRVDDVDAAYALAVAAGADEISAPTLRGWGERVGYLSDPDGHVLAFARQEQ